MALKVGWVSGSLRAASLHTAVGKALPGLSNSDVAWSHLTYDALPIYSDDLGSPDVVVSWREALAGIDALVVLTPEYNHSLPGGLKNAIDWASRPAYRSVFAGLPVGLISGSPGAVGGARAQAHARNVFAGMLSPVYAGPEVAIGGMSGKVSASGITDAATAAFVADWLSGFLAWAAATGRRRAV
jgi:chromate reductase